jgi:DNA-binding transcriptional LysR family regulator
MHKCMDWRAVKFDWNRARAFLVTAEEGSLSAAARSLGMAQPTLGRQVSALEEELGVALFERVGRGLTLTPNGLDLLEHVKAMGAAANQVSLAASGRSQSIAGPIRITAAETTAVRILPPIVAKLRAAHPAVTVEIVADNSVRDLRRREADIAIRHGRPTDPDLIARKVRDETGRLYATPAYLAAIEGDLNRADFIGFEENELFLQGLRSIGLDLSSRNFPILSDSHQVQWELVKLGAGVGVTATRFGDAEPSVQRAAPDTPPFEFPIWLVAHRELATSRRIRLAFDFLATELAALPDV